MFQDKRVFHISSTRWSHSSKRREPSTPKKSNIQGLITSVINQRENKTIPANKFKSFKMSTCIQPSGRMSLPLHTGAFMHRSNKLLFKMPPSFGPRVTWTEAPEGREAQMFFSGKLRGKAARPLFTVRKRNQRVITSCWSYLTSL